MAITYEQFVKNLEDLGIMSASEIRAFWTANTENAVQPDPQSLAGQLVRAKKLTKYQAVRVYQNKHQGLLLGKNYLIEEQIGQGGMGVVFRALHRRMDRVVAIKILQRSITRSEQVGLRFEREVKAAAKLIHPNIVTAFDADKHKGRDFLVMEYVQGKDLGEHLKRTGRFTVPMALDCVIQAATGLQYAHESGVIHRDIKPQNMLLDGNGCVKILDMGLVLSEDLKSHGSDKDLTDDHQIMGSVDYMSPEQAEDISNVDARADIYSLGCTLFRLLTGVPPYKRDKLVQKLVAHRQDPIPSLSDFRDDIPEKLNLVFQRMLAKKPADRQQDMNEVIQELSSCQLSESTEIPVSEKVTATENAAFEMNSGSSYLPEDNVDVDSAMLRFVTSIESQAVEEPILEDDSVIATERVDDIVSGEISVDEERPPVAEATVQRDGDSETMREYQILGTTTAVELSRERKTDKRIILIQAASILSILLLALLIYRFTRPAQLLLDWPVYEREDVIFKLDNVQQPIKEWPKTNRQAIDVTPGRHLLEFNRPGCKPIKKEITVGRGGREAYAVPVDLIPKDSS